MIKGKNSPNEKNIQSITLDKKTIDVLAANLIPNSKYFEVRLDHMQAQIDKIKNEIKSSNDDVDNRFQMMDNCLDEIKIDMVNRFKAVDKHFDQIIASINRMTDKIEDKDDKQRGFTLNMFTIVIIVSFTAMFMALY